MNESLSSSTDVHPCFSTVDRSRRKSVNEPPSNDYLVGLAAVGQTISNLFKHEPSSYLPPLVENETSPHLTRYCLVDHLISVARETLGDVAFGLVLKPKDEYVLGVDKNGAPSLAGQHPFHTLNERNRKAEPILSRYAQLPQQVSSSAP